MRIMGLAALGIVLAGCAGTQLKYNTLDVASTVTAIHINQVLENLSRFIDEPYALPSQVDITSGTIQTSNSVTPTVTSPLSRGSARNGGGALTGLTTAGGGLSVAASDSWIQSWLVTPISDSTNLANIMALYHYIIYGLDPNEKIKLPPAALKLMPRRIFWNGLAADGTINPPPEGVEIVNLGHFGNHDLYMTRTDFNEGYLTHLVLLVLPTTPPAAPTKGGKKGASQHAVTGPGSVRSGTGKPSILIVPQTLVEPK
jgi:hypothetical protein